MKLWMVQLCVCSLFFLELISSRLACAEPPMPRGSGLGIAEKISRRLFELCIDDCHDAYHDCCDEYDTESDEHDCGPPQAEQLCSDGNKACTWECAVERHKRQSATSTLSR